MISCLKIRCKIYKWAQIKNVTEIQIRATLEEIGNGTEFGEDFQELCTVWEYDRVSGVKNSLVTEVSLLFFNLGSRARGGQRKLNPILI